MTARYQMHLFPLLLLLASLAGCKVDSINPISSLEGAQPDTTLNGVWRYEAKGELVYVHIGPDFLLATSDTAKKNRIRIILVDHKPNGITDDAYVAYASRIGRDRYLNVMQVEAGKPVGYIFVRYTLIDDNTVRFWMMNEEALKSVIRDGQIKGTTRGEALASETAITAESPEIENYLRRDGGKLFTNPVVLKRMR
jgi:hypothetical protein